MGLDPATTLHDIRWGQDYDGRFVWVFEISGSVPASHNGGYDKSWSMRQPPMYFPLGGGTLSGVSKPGEVIWSRVFIMNGTLHVDLGRATAISLPAEETNRRLPPPHRSGRSCTPSYTVSPATSSWRGTGQPRQHCLRPRPGDRRQGATAKAAMFMNLGVQVHLCGDVLTHDTWTASLLNDHHRRWTGPVACSPSAATGRAWTCTSSAMRLPSRTVCSCLKPRPVWSVDVLDDLDEFVGAVSVLTGVVDEVACSLDAVPCSCVPATEMPRPRRNSVLRRGAAVGRGARCWY